MRPPALVPLFALTASLALAQAPAQAPETVDETAIPYYHRVRPGLATAGQPSEEALGKLKELGFKTVVNLRRPDESAPAGEQAKVEAQGLRYVSVPVQPATLGASEIAAVRAILEDESAAPVLLHCATANRAAALWGLVEVDKGRPVEEVERQVTTVGLTSPVLLETFRRLAGPAGSAAAQEDKPALRLRAFAIDLAGTTTRRADTLDIVIERWSGPDAVRTLRSALVEKGEDGLLEALQKLESVGRIGSGTRIGWQLHFAHQVPGPDGSRRIFIATDRPMSFWEVVNRPRSADYQFLLAEIRLRADGKGEGKLVPAAKVGFDEETNTLEIEEWGTEPVRLSEVTVEK